MDPTEQVSPTPHLRTETDPVSKTLRSSVFFRILDNGQSPKTQWSWMLYSFFFLKFHVFATPNFILLLRKLTACGSPTYVSPWLWHPLHLQRMLQMLAYTTCYKTLTSSNSFTNSKTLIYIFQSNSRLAFYFNSGNQMKKTCLTFMKIRYCNLGWLFSSFISSLQLVPLLLLVFT
jgi:hypothetical protein